MVQRWWWYGATSAVVCDSDVGGQTCNRFGQCGSPIWAEIRVRKSQNSNWLLEISRESPVDVCCSRVPKSPSKGFIWVTKKWSFLHCENVLRNRTWGVAAGSVVQRRWWYGAATVVIRGSVGGGVRQRWLVGKPATVWSMWVADRLFGNHRSRIGYQKMSPMYVSVENHRRMCAGSEIANRRCKLGLCLRRASYE